MAAFHDTERAREALAKIKTTNDLEASVRALETAVEALANAISKINSGEEATYRTASREPLMQGI